MAGAGHWVVIETASNQAFIFASNKQAVNVGASQLILQAGTTWVREAVEQVKKDTGAAVQEIVLASGKALLIADTEDHGKEIIRLVTQRALREAPGLPVWGAVDPEPITDDADLGPALSRALRLHASWRASKPSPLLRSPTLPHIKPCGYSGLPATVIRREGTRWYPRSTTVDAAWRQARRGRDRMAEDLRADEAVLSQDLLDRGVSEAGWVAVLHADGNGVGHIFRNLPKVYAGAAYLEQLKAFSKALDDVALLALRDAVAAQARRDSKPRRDWLLPIVIGGDDVTVIMDGRVAFDVTVDFLQRFERHSAENPVVRKVVSAIVPGGARPRGMTACAGIAYVKPHHPFSDAYNLADQLCSQAKAVKRLSPAYPRHSALDFHVLHDSVGRDLGQLREPVRQDDGSWLRLWCGPIVVSADDGSDFVDAHHVAHLRKAMDEQRALGSSALHQLREALLGGGAAIDRAEQQVRAWAEEPDAAGAYLDYHLRVPAPALPDEAPNPDEPARKVSFTRVLDALHLLDMRRGTVEGGQREFAAVAR